MYSLPQSKTLTILGITYDTHNIHSPMNNIGTKAIQIIALETIIGTRFQKENEFLNIQYKQFICSANIDWQTKQDKFFKLRFIGMLAACLMFYITWIGTSEYQEIYLNSVRQFIIALGSMIFESLLNLQKSNSNSPFWAVDICKFEAFNLWQKNYWYLWTMLW